MGNLEAFAFDSTGVAIISQAVPEDQVKQVREILRKQWPEGTPWKFPIMHLDRIFWEWMTNPWILQLSQIFMGEHFRMDHAFGVSSNGAKPQLHGGPQSSQNSCFYHSLSFGQQLGLAGQLNFGFVIDGQHPGTGGFCYVPGSHKSVDPRAGAEILDQVYRHNFNHHSLVVPELIPGDLMLFTEALIHGDTGWVAKEGQRTQIYYKMTPAFMCWRDPTQSEHLHQYAVTDLEKKMIQPPWTGRYDEDERSMGFNNERREKTCE